MLFGFTCMQIKVFIRNISQLYGNLHAHLRLYLQTVGYMNHAGYIRYLDGLPVRRRSPIQYSHLESAGRLSYLSGDVTDNTFFRLNTDDTSLNKMVHDAASWVHLGHELTIVAYNQSSDHVVRCHCKP